MSPFWMGVAAPFAVAAACAALYILWTLIRVWWKDWRPSIERNTDRFGRAHVAAAFMVARVFFFAVLPGGYLIVFRSRVRHPEGEAEKRYYRLTKEALRAFDEEAGPPILAERYRKDQP